MAGELPAGFTVDQPTQQGGSPTLPDGFTVDVPQPQLPDTANIEKTAQDNVAQNDNAAPQTPVQSLTTALGYNPVAPYKQGNVLPQPVRQHINDSYAAGTATTAADCMQSTVPIVAAQHGASGEWDNSSPLHAESPATTFLKSLGVDVPSMVAGVPAFTAAAAATGKTLAPMAKGRAGAIAVGAASIVAGTMAAMAASGVEKATQDKFLKDHPEIANAAGISQEQMAIDVAANPISAKLGSMASQLVAFKPGLPAKDIVKTMLVNAGIMGGTETGREIVSGEKLDPFSILAQSVTGAIMKNNAFGEKLSSAGEKFAAGYEAMRKPIADQTNVPPAQVANDHIDSAIAAAHPHDLHPDAVDYDHAATVMFGEDGADKGAKLLRDINSATGIRPEQVYDDAKNSPDIATDLRNGVIPKAYDHLIQQQPVPKAPEGVQYTTLDPASKEFSIAKMIAAGKGIELQPAPKAGEAPRENVPAAVEQLRANEPESIATIPAKPIHTDEDIAAQNVKKLGYMKELRDLNAKTKLTFDEQQRVNELEKNIPFEAKKLRDMRTAVGKKPMGNLDNLKRTPKSAAGVLMDKNFKLKPTPELNALLKEDRRINGGKGKLNGLLSNKGKTLEQALTKLQQTGHFEEHPEGSPNKIGDKEVMDMLYDHIRGKPKYAVKDLGRIAEKGQDPLEAEHQQFQTIHGIKEDAYNEHDIILNDKEALDVHSLRESGYTLKESLQVLKDNQNREILKDGAYTIPEQTGERTGVGNTEGTSPERTGRTEVGTEQNDKQQEGGRTRESGISAGGREPEGESTARTGELSEQDKAIERFKNQENQKGAISIFGGNAEEIIETLKEPAYKKYAEAREELEDAVQGKKTKNTIEDLAKTVAAGHDEYGAVYDHMQKPSMTEAEEVARNKRVFNMSAPKDELPTPKTPDQLVNPDFAKEEKKPPTLFGKISDHIDNMISADAAIRSETKNLSDLGKLAEEDPVMAGKIAARYIHETLSPDTVSDVAGDAATILKERLGVSKRETAIAQNALNKVWRSAGKLVGAQKDSFIDYMQNRSNGATIDPALQETADVVRKINQDIESKLQALPGNEQRAFIKDYFTQNWKDTAISRRVMNEAIARQGSGRNLEQRIIPSHAEGIALGLEDKFDHPLETVMNYVKNVQKYIAHVEAVNDMVEGGMAKRFKGDEDTTGYTKLEGNVGADNGEGAVYAQDDAARIYNNAISKGFEGGAGEIFKAINFSSNVLRRMKLGLLNFFHAGVITQASMSSEFGLGTKEITGAFDKDNPQDAGLSIIKGAARMALSTLAPFKHLAEGGKGLQEYKAPGSTDPRTQQIIDILSRANAITSSMPEYMKSGAQVDLWDGWKRGDFDNFSDKASDFVNKLTLKNSAVKIPKLMFQTVARAMDTTVKPLFDWYTPRMKTGAAMEAMGQFMDTHPNATHDEQLQAASAIGDSIDNRMGEMLTQNLFLNRKLEQSINQGFLSYGWVLGQLRGGIGGAKDIAMFKNTPNAQYIIGTIATTALLNTLYQYLHTDKLPDDLKDLMAPKTGGIQNAGGEVVPEREFGPSHESQWYHYANDFTGELFGNEANPLIPFVMMLKNGTNWAGYDVTNRNDPKVMDYIRAMGDQMEPIMLSTLEKGAKKGSHLTTAERALGFRQVPAFVANPEGVKEQTEERNERNWQKSQKFEEKQKDSYEK